MENQWLIQKSFYLLEWPNSIPSLLLVCFTFTTPFPKLFIHTQRSARRHRIHNYISDRSSKDGGTRPNTNEFRYHMAPLASGETVFGLSRSVIIQPILLIVHLFSGGWQRAHYSLQFHGDIISWHHENKKTLFHHGWTTKRSRPADGSFFQTETTKVDNKI